MPSSICTSTTVSSSAFGRYFTPFTYDQYAISNYWLPTPERSVFTTNVGLGRQIGVMGWGYLFDKRLDYAAGIFNGSRNSFESLNNGVDFVAFLNARPFQESESLEFAKFLNLGTSFAFGHQDQPAVPAVVSHRRGVSECRRPRARHDAIPDPQPQCDRARRPVARVRPCGLLLQEPVADRRVAIRLRQLRDPSAHPTSVQVPFSGFYVVGGYFLTGEQVERRSRVTPLRPFIPTKRGTRSVRAPGRSSGASASCAWAKRSSPPGSPTRISGPTRPSRPNSA